jgi:hypothetical protein
MRDRWVGQSRKSVLRFNGTVGKGGTRQAIDKARLLLPLDEAAPMTAALSRRVSDLPPLAKLAAKARHDYGDAYCGGKIGASLRKVAATSRYVLRKSIAERRASLLIAAC